MKTTELDYHLPEELIAQQGLAVRENSRLLVLHRADGVLEHRRFTDLLAFMEPGDCLVLNESKVIPARFYAQRLSGGKIEGLFLKLDPSGAWQVILKNAAKLKKQEELVLLTPATMQPEQDAPRLQILARQGQGNWLLAPRPQTDHLALLHRFGVTPLPPYIRRRPGAIDPDEGERYQTVYAKTPGSVAAPTAGLHFSADMLEALKRRQVLIAHVTLHVGLDTFKPVTVETLEDHCIHTEYCCLDAANAEIINRTLDRERRLIAVGTTSVRTLESCAHDGRVRAYQGPTRLFITPGYRFQIVKSLVTNFHLPRTTLLALVCAFAGKEHILRAYQAAIEQRYRFFSYGDAMLIL